MQMTSRSFASDNNSGVIPEVMSMLLEVNHNHVPAYGNDVVTNQTRRLFKEIFGPCQTYFVFNGTAANNLCLSPFLKPFEAVICSEHAHIHQNECGAPERLLGVQLQTLKAPFGKLEVSQIREHLQKQRFGDIHSCQPRVISITQPTELGTAYSLEEMQQISQLAKKYNLFFHIDGSRLVNAAVALSKSLKEITVDVGADSLSLGGTKNGLMLAEACVFFHQHNKADIPYHQKQLLQLPGKSRFVAAQFYAWLKNDVWKKYAQHANSMALLLASKVQALEHVKIVQAVESNAVFAQIPRVALKKARQNFFFYVWEDTDPSDESILSPCLVRWLTTYDTTMEDIDAFVADLRKAMSFQY